MSPTAFINVKPKVMHLVSQGNLPKAISLLEQCVQAHKGDIEAQWVLAQLLEKAGRPAQAFRLYFDLSRFNSPITHQAKVRALHTAYVCDDYQNGAKLASELLQLEPTNHEYWYKRGKMLNGIFHYLAASECFKKALENAPDPQHARTYGLDYARDLSLLGRNQEALKLLRQWVAEKEGGALGDNEDEHLAYYLYVACHNYVEGLDNRSVFEAHREFGSRLEQRFAEIKTLPTARDNSRLKVAFISSDFRNHSVALFIKPVLKCLDRTRFEVTCYSDVRRPDQTTQTLANLCERWCDVADMNDEVLSGRIREDQQDIVIDLVGYLGSVRLGVFARRVAPVQMTYLGYPNTTGLQRIDYRITDHYADPAGDSQPWHSEALLALPGLFLCFEPLDEAPDVAPLPAIKNGHVTFGSTNVYTKVTAQMLNTWLQILKSCPGSKLIIKAKQFSETAFRDQVLAQFEAQLGEPGRVEVLGWLPRGESHLGFYDRIDIHLDTYPYNGTTTTFEALWQGVPSVTLAGNNHRSRVGLSIMSNIGHEDWVAHSQQEYIDLALAKASDLDALETFRAGIRNDMRESGVMDGERFTRKLEGAFERAWQERLSQ